ncbi:MAG: hypothetical protein JO122_08830 [Acetobacteraceae bacterium]|nr:hypothetical protein [Acetobacteraceae bacterium]
MDLFDGQNGSFELAERMPAAAFFADLGDQTWIRASDLPGAEDCRHVVRARALPAFEEQEILDGVLIGVGTEGSTDCFGMGVFVIMAHHWPCLWTWSGNTRNGAALSAYFDDSALTTLCGYGRALSNDTGRA